MSGQLKLLEEAAKVLMPETILLIHRTLEINRFGMCLLDRWALAQPEELKALERKSRALLVLKVLEQQGREQKNLEWSKNQAKLANGLMPHEVLDLQELLKKL